LSKTLASAKNSGHTQGDSVKIDNLVANTGYNPSQDGAKPLVPTALLVKGSKLMYIATPVATKVLRRPGLLALVLFLCCLGASLADPFPPDPVEKLSRFLSSRPVDPKEFSAGLQKLTGELQSISDLYRALNLREWTNAITPEQADVVGQQQAQLVERLREKARRILQSGDVPSQLATLTLIGDVGASALTPESPSLADVNRPIQAKTSIAAQVLATGRLGRAYQADLVDLMRHARDERLRTTAARTLGQILPDPKEAVPALRSLLDSPKATERRAAAAGLMSMVRVATQLVASTGSPGALRIPISRRDWIEICSQVVPALGCGLADSDLEVRYISAQGFDQVAAGLENQVKQLATAGEDAPIDPLVAALSDQASPLARAVLDADAAIRILSRRVLEHLGSARDRLLHPVPAESSLPDQPEEARLGTGGAKAIVAIALYQPAPTEPRAAPRLLEVLRAALPALRKGVSDPVPAARIQAVEVLETMGPAAAPAVPELIKALGDTDRFVRWAAARTLGKVGTEEAGQAVLPLAGLLHDPDLDVDLAAATALERFGPKARDAVPSLVRALKASDVKKREAAIRTLTSIGTDARSAIPALVAALADPDVPVRRHAAELLGKFGAAATSALPALQRALADPDSGVRQDVSAALLKIAPPAEPR